MDWCAVVINLATAFVGAAGGAGLVVTLIKSFINHQLQKELEQVKSSLKVLVDRQQIVFSKLHTERAEVIKNLYVKIQFANSDIRLMVTGNGSIDNAVDKINELNNYFQFNKILLDEKLSMELEQCCRYAFEIINLEGEKQKPYSDKRTIMSEQLELLEKKFKLILVKLEQTFRSTLGASDGLQQ